MEYRKLGNTDIKVSVVTMGCWGIAGGANWGAQDENLIKPTVEAALDAGVNCFDTAPAYGDSEKLLAHALGSRRKDVVIATKLSSGDLAPNKIAAACDKSLRDLDTDFIDLYQIHWPSHKIPLADTLGEMNRLIDKGKIRAIGVSNFGPVALAEAFTHAPIASNQLSYSLIARAIEYEIVPICEKKNIGVLCYSPLMQGLLTGKFKSAADVPAGRARTRHFNSANWPDTRHGEKGCEPETFAAINDIRKICDELKRPMSHVALAWCLYQPAVATVLAGARTPEQMKENAGAASLKLSDDILKRLGAATLTVKERLGKNADLWGHPSEARMR